MGKILAILAVFFCGCILTISCDDNETKTIGYERDNSLAGSISFVGYKMEAEGSYDENILESFQYDLSYLDIRKVSDNEILLFCFSKWGRTTLKISIPVIHVSGEPHDATFDYSSNDATIIYDDVEYTLISATIDGRIKEVDVQGSSNNGGGRDPATPEYTCKININCNVNGKKLNLKITSVKP